LDTGRPVIWSISRIAISGAPNALDLIHDLLLAPISIGLRSVSSLIRTQGIGDLDRIYLEAQLTGWISTWRISRTTLTQKAPSHLIPYT